MLLFKAGPVLFSIWILLCPGSLGQSNTGFNSTSMDQIVYVDDDNTQGPWDGSLEHPYQHINDAIKNATENCTVYVFNGYYPEQVIVTKTLRLLGENKTKTIIDGGGEHGSTISLEVNGITVSGFTVTGGGTWANDAGIHWQSYYPPYSSHNTITGNMICHNKNEGIEGWLSSSDTITNNTFIDNPADNRINPYFYPCIFSDNILIDDSISILNLVGHADRNRFQNGSLYCTASNSSLIRNTFTNGGILELADGTNNTIRDTTFTNASGLYFTGDTPEAWNSHTIDGNTIDGRPIIYFAKRQDETIPADAAEIIAASCTNLRITNQDIHDTIGIQCSDCQHTTLAANRFTTSGIQIIASNDTVLTNNTIRNCTDLDITSSNHCLLSSNTFTHTSCLLTDSQSSNITENTFNNASIRARACSYTRITHNIIKDYPGDAITIEWGTKNLILANTITNTDRSLYLVDTSSNEIIANNFMSNSKTQAAFSSDGLLKSHNFWLRNYWTGHLMPGPKLIPGAFNTHIYIHLMEHSGYYIYLPWLNIDWTPSRQPHAPYQKN